MVLDARFVVRRRRAARRRTVPAAEFFVGPYTTAVEPGELLEAVELDAPPAGTGSAFVELHPRRTAPSRSWASRRWSGSGTDGSRRAQRASRSAGSAARPTRRSGSTKSCSASSPATELFEAVGTRVADSVEPGGDGHAGPEYRRRLAGGARASALRLAAARAGAA